MSDEEILGSSTPSTANPNFANLEEDSNVSFFEERHAVIGSYSWTDTENLSNPFTLVGKYTYTIGEENGKFDGRWNGVWSLPIKLVDSVQFGLVFENKWYWLHDYATKFTTKLSHVERTYVIEPAGTKVSEIMFIPEDRKSVCWRFVLRPIEKATALKTCKLVARCRFNLMWEVKQAGEQYRVRKEILSYNSNNYSIIARHYRHAEWICVFGANRPPSGGFIGSEDCLLEDATSQKAQRGSPSFGQTALEYIVGDSREPEEKSRFEIDFTLTGGSMSYLDAIHEYNDSLTNLETLALEKSSSYEDFLGHTVEIDHWDKSLSRSFKWSKVNLHMLEHYQEGFGSGFFAGLPHFAIYFGRDICWSTFGALAMGDFKGALESLNLLARFQATSSGEDMLREPYYKGEIPHEIRTEGTVYYYSADSTPLFPIACKNYFDWTKDLNFIKFAYNNIASAIEWSIDADRDGDGLIEHGPEGFLIDTTWMDSYYRGKSALDVQAIYCKALFEGSSLASLVGDDSRSSYWRKKGEGIKNLIQEKYWDSNSKFFVDSIRPDGELDKSVTINSIVPVLFHLTAPNVAKQILDKIDSQEFMTDWGVRTRSKTDPEYDPRSYQKGGVWPFCTGWVARADFSHERFTQGMANIKRFIRGLDMGANYFKEVLFGDMPPKGKYPVQPTGCFIQAWSASLFLSSIVEGLLGISPMRDDSADIQIVPYLDQLQDIQARNIRLGDNTCHFKEDYANDKIRIKIVNEGPSTLKIKSGFILPCSAGAVNIAQREIEALENFSQERFEDNFRVSFVTTLKEGESKEATFSVS